MFETEAALCQAFRLWVPPEWVVYPETRGWDMLVVHREGGWQIGVEAKLTLNAKVLVQAIEPAGRTGDGGPDFRAVLVGKVVAENALLAAKLGLTVIRPVDLGKGFHARTWTPEGPYLPKFHPELPKTERLAKIGEWWGRWHDGAEWFDQFPASRLSLPDYVPEVAAGVPSPLVLSEWKIRAMRVCVWVEKNTVITRAHFKRLGIDPSRWMTGAWLMAGGARGEWVAGPKFPANNLRREHPSIYEKIEADYPVWSQKVIA